MAGPKRAPGIDVAQVGHDRGLFPGSILILRTDRRAAAVGVSTGVCVCVCVCVCVYVCACVCLGSRGEQAGLGLSAVGVK